MAVSISKAQSKALADKFLDGTGTSGEFRPANTIGEFMLIAAELAEDAVENLNKSNRVDTGKLAESIEVQEPYQVAGTIHIDITELFYGKFVDGGVRGTRGGSGVYSFRNEYVGEKMLKAIKEWLKHSKRNTRTVKKYRGYGNNERKKKSIADIATSSAFAVAKSIKMKGLKATGFMSKAIVVASRKVDDRLGNALEVDVIDAITPKKKK